MSGMFSDIRGSVQTVSDAPYALSVRCRPMWKDGQQSKNREVETFSDLINRARKMHRKKFGTVLTLELSKVARRMDELGYVRQTGRGNISCVVECQGKRYDLARSSVTPRYLR